MQIAFQLYGVFRLFPVLFILALGKAGKAISGSLPSFDDVGRSRSTSLDDGFDQAALWMSNHNAIECVFELERQKGILRSFPAYRRKGETMIKSALATGLVLSLIGGASLSAYSSENHDHEERGHDSAAQMYQCPMKCEGDKTYTAPRDCPVCGMDLEAIASASSDHQDSSHQHDGGHMDHMYQVKNWLIEELGDKYDEPIPDASKSQLALGKQVFERVCWVCHGLGGKGDGPVAAGLQSPPADLTDVAHASFYSDAGRMYIIRKGIEGTQMVGWDQALTNEEIFAVYGYVRSLRASISTGHEHDTEGHEDHSSAGRDSHESHQGHEGHAH